MRFSKKCCRMRQMGDCVQNLCKPSRSLLLPARRAAPIWPDSFL